MQDKYLAAKEHLPPLDLKDLEAVKRCTRARFLEEGEKALYFFSLEKHCQASQLIQTLKNENSDILSDTRNPIAEIHLFYTNLYKAEPTNTPAQ